MLARVAMPAVRQKRSKLAPTSCQASSMVATGTTAAVVGSFMALLSFVDSAPRAYRLKVGNACPPISTSTGTSPAGLNTIHIGPAVGTQKSVPKLSMSAKLLSPCVSLLVPSLHASRHHASTARRGAVLSAHNRHPLHLIRR